MSTAQSRTENMKAAMDCKSHAKVLKLTVTLTEQHTQSTEEHPGKLSIPLPLVVLNQEIRTPDQASMAAHALRGLADLLDEQRGVKVDR